MLQGQVVALYKYFTFERKITHQDNIEIDYFYIYRNKFEELLLKRYSSVVKDKNSILSIVKIFCVIFVYSMMKEKNGESYLKDSYKEIFLDTIKKYGALNGTTKIISSDVWQKEIRIVVSKIKNKKGVE